ncbi:hypothetical protein [Pseudomonas sp. lyk4-TYG-107]|uniref:hypothetical protein n=1 Tax=Pseudomonas sp. lyk4-TYG-107 TaxID=3040317 RepID=UPI002555B064|nr:hypothetical protein [Pseudomonas sp. lyk4-TYG-107]
MIYSLPTKANLRNRLARWTTPVLISMAFGSLVLQQACLSKLSQRLDELADSTHLQHLDDRIVEVEQSLSRLSLPQGGVSYSDLNLINESFNERIAELADVITGTASQSDLKDLRQRVQQLESNQPQHPVMPIAPRPKFLSRKPTKPAEPPIQILGQEIRGGERFLSLGPKDAESLEQCQLIRVGETYYGWRLDGIDEQIAVFTANGLTHRLSIR